MPFFAVVICIRTASLERRDRSLFFFLWFRVKLYEPNHDKQRVIHLLDLYLLVVVYGKIARIFALGDKKTISMGMDCTFLRPPLCDQNFQGLSLYGKSFRRIPWQMTAKSRTVYTYFKTNIIHAIYVTFRERPWRFGPGLIFLCFVVVGGMVRPRSRNTLEAVRIRP